jgi:ABC-type polar amino acid transport system ATPase subunit
MTATDAHPRDPFARPGKLTPAGAEPIVRLEAIEKYFGSNHVLRGCTVEVYPRSTICIIGRSGSGKSTLLRSMIFLEEPTAGAVEVDGLRIEADPLTGSRNREYQERIRQVRLRAQMVFQEFNLFPHMRVIDNLIEAPIRVRGIPRDEAIATAEKYLDKVGLRDKRDEYPARLSGGQKQRVAIARALLEDPRLLVLDEATSALDAESEHLVQEALERLMRGRTTLIIAHRLSTVVRADRVVVVQGGRVVQLGSHSALLAEDGPYRRLVERQFVAA